MASIEQAATLFESTRDELDARLGQMFPEVVNLPIGGGLTEEGVAIFGNHLSRLEERERIFKVRIRFELAMRQFLRNGGSVTGDVVVANVPLEDFTDEQNQLALQAVGASLDGLVVRDGFVNVVDAQYELPRYVNPNASDDIEIVQEHLLEDVHEDNLAGHYVRTHRIYPGPYQGPTYGSIVLSNASGVDGMIQYPPAIEMVERGHVNHILQEHSA